MDCPVRSSHQPSAPVYPPPCHFLQVPDEEKSAASSISDASSICKEDPSHITWESTTDPENPKNWGLARKWAITIIVSAFAFTTPMSSSISAPALSLIADDLHITSSARTNLILSIFLLSYAFGAFVLSPCSEIFGRRWVIQSGNLMFLLFNTGCGFARTESELLVLRLLAGLGGSANVGIGSGVLSDCWSPEERGKGMAIYQLAPVLGPSLAPIAGGFLSQYASWQWTFWSISIFCGCLQILALFVLRETYAPRILAMKAKRRTKMTNIQYTCDDWRNQSLSDIVTKSMVRPWRLIGTQPIIQILSLYQAFNYGMLYLVISSLNPLFEQRYGMSKSVASFNYLALLGSLPSSQITGYLTDKIHARLCTRHGVKNGQGLPEFRLPLMVPAAAISTIGILIFGWAADAELHWIVPDIGIFLFAGASLTCYLSIQMYIVDAYPRYAASASSASAVVRFMAAFAFPLFGPSLFQRMGYGIGGTILACVSGCLGIPAPLLLWKFGAKLRARSTYAAGDQGVEQR